MEAQVLASSTEDQHSSTVQTCIMTSSAASAPQISSVVDVVPPKPLMSHSSTLITDVLPPEGFTLVNLDLESLHLDQTTHQQLEEYEAQEVDELEDGVSLVVKGSWWWCKDCGIKQRFGFGESIEDHLRNKHNINNRMEDLAVEEFTQNSQVDQGRRTPASGEACSEVISSLYTISSDSVCGQDQNVETFIVIDDNSSTVQVIAEQTADHTILFTPLNEEHKRARVPHSQSKVIYSSGLCNSEVVGSSSCVLKPLSPMKPIPVLPALLPGMQTPSVLPTSASQCGEVVEVTLSSSKNIPEIRPLPHAEKKSMSKITVPKVRASCVRSTEKEPISIMKMTEMTSGDGSSSKPCSNSGRVDLTLTTAASKCGSGGHKTYNDGKTCAAERPVIIEKGPAESGMKSCGMITRRKACQISEQKRKGIQVMDCSIHLRRMSSNEIKLKNYPERACSKSNSGILTTKAQKQTKNAKSVLLKSKFSLEEYAKNNKLKAQTLQHVGKKKIHNTTAHLVVGTRKNIITSSMKTRTLSGRKVRKPARYISGSEDEDDSSGKEQADQQSQHTVPAASSGEPHLCPEQESPHLEPSSRSKKIQLSQIADQGSPKNPSRLLKKRTLSPVVGLDESCGKKSDPVQMTDLKKAKNESYSCQDCGRMFRYRRKLEKHRTLYAGQAIQWCTVCNKALHSTDLLNVHMYHVHLTKESTSCFTCTGKILGSKRNLLNHLLTHPNTEGQTVANLIKDSCAVHDCSFCDEPIIIGEGRVERHYMIHEKPGECTCQKCGQSFRHKKELYSHLRSHGDFEDIVPQRAYQSDSKGSCIVSSSQQARQTADSGFVTYTQMHEHDLHNSSIQADEIVIAESVRQVMKFEESTPTAIENQVTVTLVADKGPTECQQSMLMARPLVYCELCKKQFTTKKLLYQHLKVHGSESSDAAEKSDSSGVCNEGEPVVEPVDLSAGVPFGIPCSLVKLEHQEHDGDFLRKSFTTTSEGLEVPGEIHFSCALCDREFESESRARRHTSRFSSQQTILQCNLCACKLHNLDLLNVHYVYIHQPEGLATCMTCKADFTNKADFIAHLGNSPLAHPQSYKLGFATVIQDACGTVTCTVCQKSMWNYPMNIANHTKKHRSLSCPICKQEMPYKYALFIHLQIHANSKNLTINTFSEVVCEQNEQIEKLHSIVTEVESSTFVETTEKFSCSLCEGEVLCTRKNIHQHLDLHARKLLQSIREGRYFCPDCGEDIIVSDLNNISVHLHSPDQSQAMFVCIFCSQTFATFDQFKAHETKKHWLNAYFEKNMCEVCGKEFVSHQQFQKHLKLHEEKQGLFSCLHCKQTFRFESKLQKHMGKHRKGCYACQYCGKLYMTKLSLDRHEQVVHIGIKDFKHKCKMCEAQFINATHLRDHVTNKHLSGASYRCLQCGMGFQYLSTFARHKRVIHGGDTPYVCQECGEKFPQKKLLQHHSMVHTGINPFQCPKCPKTFGLERTMREHFDFSHQGIQRFVCPHCGNKFPRKRSLKRHLGTCRMLLSAGPHLSQVEQGPMFDSDPKVPLEVQAAGSQLNTAWQFAGTE